LTDLEDDRFVDARSLRDAKRVLRAALEACLDGRELEVARGHARDAPPRGAAASRRLAAAGAAVSASTASLSA
jgi:hypothetical protein